MTPILPNSKEEIIDQFNKTADLISKINFPNSEIKNSICGIVLMLSNIYFDETDAARKRIQGVYMGKVDCVVEALQEKYEEGLNQGNSEGYSKGYSKGKTENSIDIAKKLLERECSVNWISEITGLSVSKIEEIRDSI